MEAATRSERNALPWWESPIKWLNPRQSSSNLAISERFLAAAIVDVSRRLAADQKTRLERVDRTSEKKEEGAHASSVKTLLDPARSSATDRLIDHAILALQSAPVAIQPPWSIGKYILISRHPRPFVRHQPPSPQQPKHRFDRIHDALKKNVTGSSVSCDPSKWMNELDTDRVVLKARSSCTDRSITQWVVCRRFDRWCVRGDEGPLFRVNEVVFKVVERRARRSSRRWGSTFCERGRLGRRRATRATGRRWPGRSTAGPAGRRSGADRGRRRSSWRRPVSVGRTSSSNGFPGGLPFRGAYNRPAPCKKNNRIDQRSSYFPYRIDTSPPHTHTHTHKRKKTR